MTYNDLPPEDPYANVTPLHPHANPAAEAALISLVLTTPEIAPALIEAVNSDDFYEPRHETIWDAATAVLADGLLPDHSALIAQLAKTHQLANARLEQYTPATTGAIHTQANWYADTIRRLAIQRRAVTALRQSLQHAETATNPQDIDMALGGAMDALDTSIRVLYNDGPTHRGGPNYVTFTGLFSRPKTPTPWQIAPILAAGRISLLYSPGKTGKSLIAMEAAAALATGRACLATQHPGTPQHVLYIDQEMTEDDWADRLRDMGYTPDDEPLLAEHLHLAQLHAWPPMDTPAGGKAVHDAVKATGATTVIIDTASKVIAGEENSNDTQQQFYRSTLIPLKRDGLAVLVLDHTGKDLEKGARGGSAKTDNIDLAFELIKRGRDTLTMRCTHARFRDELLEEPTLLRRGTAPLVHHIEHLGLSDEAAGAVRPTTLMERVSRFIQFNPAQSKTAIETAVKGRREYVRLALELLIAEQYVETKAGPNRSTVHHHIRPFNEQDDNQ